MSVINSKRAERCNFLGLAGVMSSSASRSFPVLGNVEKPYRVVQKKKKMQRPNRAMMKLSVF